MEVKSRVPGKMIEVNVAVGDTVAEKDVLGVMEAMKMNQKIACPCAGEVKEIKFAAGDRIEAGDVMFVVE
jgi:biotin carboxyl carrier protein